MSESIMAYFLVLCTVLVAVNQAQGLVSSNARSRRETKGLFPFPRVGRRGGEMAWMLGSNDLMDRQVKKQGLMAFPRVGRSGNAFNDRVEGGALWIGPRLGRDIRLNIPKDISPWTLITLREFEAPPESETNGAPHETREEIFDYDLQASPKQQDISNNISH
ncbi:unnamed protein product [Bemisia tabaci]|uniref:Cardio acceleratory peptide 2b n=1 Tax=Bemisia tabaci TaxID=7038 RepID=A0A9P0F0H5_BEMTA|nr:PREDICTED: uncharacterized protein LOC109029779 [Bemisia tabaci]CAH0386756.1 unnamed protein product [Bemisia tabaci]